MGRSAQLESLRAQLVARGDEIASLRRELDGRNNVIDLQDGIIARQAEEIKRHEETDDLTLRHFGPIIEAATVLVHYGDPCQWADSVRTSNLIEVDGDHYGALLEAVHAAWKALESLLPTMPARAVVAP